MALVVKDRVLETSNTNGTGTFTLAGAVNGFQAFSVIGVGNTTYYAITEETNNQWEVGLGTVGSGTLTRDTVLSSSNSGNKVDFADGLKQVFCDYPASKSVNLDANGKVLFGGNTYEDFTSTTAPSYSEGRVWYDSTEKALAFYNDSSSLAVHVSQDLIFKVINNTGSTIPNGSPVYITSTSTGQSYPNVALAKADVAATSAVIGLTNGAIANGATGYVSSQGTIDNVNTSTFTVGQVLYLSPYSAGQLMNTIPPTGITVQVGVATYIDSSAGHIYVKQTTPLAVPASIVTGTLGVDHGGTGQSSALVAGAVVYGSSTTAMGVTAAGTSGQVLTSAGAGTPTWTTPTTGTVTSVGGTGTVSGISLSGTVTSSGNLTLGGTLDLSSPPAIGATTPAAGTFTTITGQTEVLRGTGQNLSLQSQTYTNATWSSSTATRADNQTTAPNGTTTAGTFTTVNTTFGGLLRQFITFTSTTYTLSAYVKKNNWRYVGLRFGTVVGTSDKYAFFDFDTLTTNTVGISGATLTATDAGSGWYRLALTGANTSVGSTVADISTVASDGNCQTNLGAGQIVNVWGVQLEIGSVANTYIPTTTTAVYGTPTLSFSGVAGLGLQSDGSLYVSPAGTGALQAQATTSSTVGGNARGANAVDWQTSRNAANQVASNSNGVIGGGNANLCSGFAGSIVGGSSNISNNNYTFVGGGLSNTASSPYAIIAGGYANTSAGYLNFVGAGYGNSGTASAAVTTQSGTMNATTAVTLSGSNASIKVGQLITGTSINSFPNTYVAAISGTALTLSQAASGSSTSTLSFYTPHGVVVGGGNNQATGSYSFIGGGGDAGTAANRNAASGDWSFIGGGWGHVASGAGGVVAGGGIFGGTSTSNGNTASGTSSGVLSGINNTASGLYSQLVGGRLNTSDGSQSGLFGGSFGTTRGITGYTVFPASVTPIATFAQGNSQAALLVLGRQTTDATATVLTSDTASARGTNQIILPNNSAYYFTGEVISGVTGGGDSKGWEIAGVIKRGANAASTTLVGSTVTSLYADAGAATWTIGLTADTTNGGLKVTFTGQASTTIRTVCQIRTTEMTY